MDQTETFAALLAVTELVGRLAPCGLRAKMDSKTDSKIVDAAIGTGVLALGLLAHRYGLSEEAVAVISAGQPLADVMRSSMVATFYTRLMGDRDRDAFDELVRAFAEVGNYETTEAQARLAMILSASTKEQAERLNEAFQAMFFGRSPAAWPFVARLTADRIVNHESIPDALSRRVAWLLQRCEAEDVEILVDACRSSRALVNYLQSRDGQALGGTRSGISWEFSDTTGFYLQTHPDALTNAHLLGRVWERPRELEVLALVGESRIGFYRDGCVYFALDTDVHNRLISLFCQGEPPRLPRTTAN